MVIATTHSTFFCLVCGGHAQRILGSHMPLMPLTNTLRTKTSTNTITYPVSLHKLEHFMLHFSSTLLVCMQSRHQDCRQQSSTLCVQDCDQNFFRAPLGIFAGKSPGYRYRYWLRFWGRPRYQTSERFSRRPTAPISKTRCQPYQTISHAHHEVYPKIAPGEERISLSVPMLYVVHMCHM